MTERKSVFPIPQFGGCACGAIRYRLNAEPVDTGYCHCHMCQKLSAAPAVPWASLPLHAVLYQEGEPRVFRSSSRGERRFCGNCGTPLEFRGVNGDLVGLNTVTLDNPELIRPAKHIWCSSKISWFNISDDLPVFDEE